MFFQSINNHLNVNILTKSNLINYLTPLQKKIAAFALTIFCACALSCYICGYILSSFYANKKRALVDQEDEKSQQQFNNEIKSYDKSPISEIFPDKDIKIDDVASEIFTRKDVKIDGVASEIFPDKDVKIDDDANDEKEIPLNHKILHDNVNVFDSPTIDPIKEELLLTPYHAKIAIVSRIGGVIGPDLDKFKSLNQWKLSDGSDFPLQPDTLLLRFTIFYPTDECQSFMTPGISFLLPAYLFKDKKEGEIIQLQYQGNVIQLELNQVECSKGRSGNYPSIDDKAELFNFDIFFKDTSNFVTKAINFGSDKSIFVMTEREELENDLAGYTLDFGGKLYHCTEHPNQRDVSIEEVDSEEFQEIEDLSTSQLQQLADGIRVFSDVVPGYNDDTIIRTNLCGFPGEGIDLIVNEKCICLYRAKTTFPSLRIIYWKKYFKDLSLEQMQDSIQRSIITLNSGIFTMTLPIKIQQN